MEYMVFERTDENKLNKGLFAPLTMGSGQVYCAPSERGCAQGAHRPL